MENAASVIDAVKTASQTLKDEVGRKTGLAVVIVGSVPVEGEKTP